MQDTGGVPYPIPSYRFWTYYIKNGIEEAGMEWTELQDADWAKGLTFSEKSPELQEWKSQIWEDQLAFIRKNQKNIDLFLTYLYPKQIDIHAISEIKKMGIPCVNFFCDNIREFHVVPDEFKVFDLNWVPEFESLEMYNKQNVQNIHLPMPMWVDRQARSLEKITETNLVSFIGSKDILRERLLSEVINKGLPIEIYGRDWVRKQENTFSNSNKSLINVALNQWDFIKANGIKEYLLRRVNTLGANSKKEIDPAFLHPDIDFSEYIAITRNSSVILGINRVPTHKRLHSHPIKYSRLRDIEAPMLGACYLTEHCHGLSSMYELGKDIMSYNTSEELVDKASFLLNHASVRESLRINGQNKALKELSIPASLQKIKMALFR